MTITRTTRTTRRIAAGAVALGLALGLGSGVADASGATQHPLNPGVNIPVHPIDPDDPQVAIPTDPCPLGDCPDPDPEDDPEHPEDDPEHPEDDPEHPEDDPEYPGDDPEDPGDHVAPGAGPATPVSAQPTFTG